MQVKILSWNIWIDSYFDQIKEFLKSSQADVIGLQEVREDDPSRETIKYLNSLGYQQVFAPTEKDWGEKVWSDGPAVFTNYDIASSKKYILSIEYYSDKIQSIPYRGLKDALFKRPFSFTWQKQYPSLSIINQGFLTKDQGFDNCHWWLFQK